MSTRDEQEIPELLREMIRTARQFRSTILPSDQPLKLRNVYTLSFHIARELRSRFPDVCIMVGDRITERGAIQHFWLEVPSRELFLDCAHDELDPFQPVRAGKTSDADFAATYLNREDANFDLDDPRNRPELLFKAKSAWDPET